MNSHSSKFPAFVLLFVFTAIDSAIAQDNDTDVEPVYHAELDPITIKGNSVEDAGFSFVAKFRMKMPWAGIKTLVVTKVGEDSPAAKAGIGKGAKIVKIRDREIDGIKIKELQDLLQEKSETGKIPLTILSRNSDQPREVVLEFVFEKTKRQKKADMRNGLKQPDGG